MVASALAALRAKSTIAWSEITSAIDDLTARCSSVTDDVAITVDDGAPSDPEALALLLAARAAHRAGVADAEVTGEPFVHFSKSPRVLDRFLRDIGGLTATAPALADAVLVGCVRPVIREATTAQMAAASHGKNGFLRELAAKRHADAAPHAVAAAVRVLLYFGADANAPAPDTGLSALQVAFANNSAVFGTIVQAMSAARPGGGAETGGSGGSGPTADGLRAEVATLSKDLRSTRKRYGQLLLLYGRLLDIRPGGGKTAKGPRMYTPRIAAGVDDGEFDEFATLGPGGGDESFAPGGGDDGGGGGGGGDEAATGPPPKRSEGPPPAKRAAGGGSAGTKEHGAWYNLCHGNGAASLVLAPFVLLYQAVRLLLWPCVRTYAGQFLCLPCALACPRCCMYTDKEFPADASSLGDIDDKDDITWERAGSAEMAAKLYKKPKGESGKNAKGPKMSLFNGMS